jgi:hypothetical protein
MPGHVHFELSLKHRSVLGRRNQNGKVAVPRHCDLLQVWVLRAVAELVAVGVLEGLGKTVIDWPGGAISCEVFGLTDRGRDLCETHDIWKAE